MITLADLHSKESEAPIPQVGQWFWVRLEDEKGQPSKEETLMNVKHVGSNYVLFVIKEGQSERGERWMLWEHHNWRPATNWREVLEERMEQTKIQLRDAVNRLAVQLKHANLTEQSPGAAESRAIVISNGTPEQRKAELVRIKNEEVPLAEKTVKQATEALAATARNMTLGEMNITEKLMKAARRVNDALFSLELYAGFGEGIKLIKPGKPAEPGEKIFIHQMLRFMDEETLIAAEDGGMNFADTAQFDKWAAENIEAITPHKRAIIAWRVRRWSKHYGECRDIATALMHLRFHEWDRQTYLLIRNGEKIYRVITELDFEPRLVPFRNEFEEFKPRFRNRGEEMTPLHPEYDDAVESRNEKLKHYNRIFFIIQGLLDRTEVFLPHDRIDFANEDCVAQYVVPVRDEEDGLPTSQPISWEAYRDELNSSLKRGDVVYADFECYDKHAFTSDKRAHYCGYYRFEKKKGDKFIVSGVQTRWGYQFPKAREWLGESKGELGDWPMKRRKMYSLHRDELLNCEAYAPGEYKLLLCDAKMKGQYLRWAKFLLNCERYHKKKPTADEV